MSLQGLGKGTLRVVKNYTKGYSDVQAKVRDATSNDPWGPSGTQMNELAQMTYNQNDFVEIMEMLDKRLNDKGKNWRHVFKALTVLDYCLHAGSENVVIYFRDNIYIIKTLKEFQFVDEYGKDQGANVRQKAKDITNLLQDEARLREERRSRAHMRDRLTSSSRSDNDNLGDSDRFRSPRPTATTNSRRHNTNAEDEELNRAIELSKRSLADEDARKKEENDLQKAIKLSEEEEAKRKKALEDANARSLFDDAQQIQSNTFPLLDISSPSALQPQIQPQLTSFNPYAQLRQQEQLQAEYLAQQQQWLLQQQAQAQSQAQEEWLRQQQLQQQQAQQAQAQEEWLRQQQQQQQFQQFLQPQQPLQLFSQPTGFGSNNPFAPSQPTPVSTNSSFASSSSFSPSINSTAINTATSSAASTPSIPVVKTKSDGQFSHLANLIGNRDDGIDTFGNIGALRFGHTQAGLQAQRAPNDFNPFQANKQQQQQAANQDQPFFTV